MTSERTADADVATVRGFIDHHGYVDSDRPDEARIPYDQGDSDAMAALDRLAALVAQHRPPDATEDADAALLRDALGLPDDYGDENTAIIQRQHAALDRLVTRNQQLQEALELGARYAEGVMLREADPFLRDLHQENLDKIRAALASVRARSET